MAATDDLNVKLAVYMERLDNYIENQTTLNENLCLRLEKMNTEVDEIRDWRNKFLGARWITGGVGLLVVHTTIILSSIFAMMRVIK